MTFIMVSAGLGLLMGDGKFAGTTDPSLSFLFRAWVLPPVGDYWVLVLLGVASAFGGFFISQAYRVSEAALVAPFEYIAMPMAIVWGILVFDEWPDGVALAGIALILGSGLYMIWREARLAEVDVPYTPRYRR
jgi:drug/metabolite transporter (DMT)-like permease